MAQAARMRQPAGPHAHSTTLLCRSAPRAPVGADQRRLWACSGPWARTPTAPACRSIPGHLLALMSAVGMQELDDLQTVTQAEHVKTNRMAQAARRMRYPVAMCAYSYALLECFLQAHKLKLPLHTLNERIGLQVRRAQGRARCTDQVRACMHNPELYILRVGILGARTVCRHAHDDLLDL